MKENIIKYSTHLINLPIALLFVLLILPEIKYYNSEQPLISSSFAFLNTAGTLFHALWILSLGMASSLSLKGSNYDSKMFHFLDLFWLVFVVGIYGMIELSDGNELTEINIGLLTFKTTITRPVELMYSVMAIGLVILFITTIGVLRFIEQGKPKLWKIPLFILFMMFPFIGVWFINPKMKMKLTGANNAQKANARKA